MSRKVVQLKTIGTVTFSQNQRSKNIKISVKPDKTVLVSFPFFCTTKEALAFVQKNEGWVLKQKRKMELRKNNYNLNSEIQTKLYTVKFKGGSKYDVGTSRKEVTITLKDFESDKSQQYIESILTQIYRYEANKLLPPRLAELAKKHGFSYQKITVRNNKRNWGSCSSKNNISLNLQMMKLPDYLIDYILLHELVHTIIKNHGPKFWEKLNELTSNRARKLSKEIKGYSTYTL